MILRDFLSLLFIFCFTSLAHAEFRLTPGIDLWQEYNDNIDLDHENEEDDFITVIAPNVSMNWETRRLEATLNASVVMEKHYNNPEDDRIGADSRQTSSLNFLARLYRDVFFLKVNDSYERVPVDEGGRGGEGNRNINLTDSNRLQINPYLQFQPMKATQVRLGYTYENQWYEEDLADDAESYIHTASITRQLSPRISMSLSGGYTQYRPKNTAETRLVGVGGAYDFDRKDIGVGLSYQPTQRLHLNGQYGHTWLDYSVIGDSDSDTWSAGLEYEVSSNYTAGVQYSTDYTVSIEDGPSEIDYLELYLKYEERFGLNFSLFSKSRDYVEINRSTDSYGASISGDVPFNEKVGITGLLRYTHFNDSGVELDTLSIAESNGILILDLDRTDLLAEEYDRYSTSFSIYYETRLGRVSAGHIFNVNDTDLYQNKYKNNIVYLQASLKF